MHRMGLISLAAALLIFGCSDDDSQGNNQNQNNATPAICGDGELDTGEECDNGAQNSDSAPDACRTDCRQAYCGDGVVDTDEECDEGGANSDLVPGACRRTCVLSHCGDGVIDHGEACDDANADDGDGCSGDCQVEPYFQCEDVPSQCRCIDHRSGPGCLTCVVYVDADAGGDPADGLSWDTAFRKVQPAIDAAHLAGRGCEVWVAEGTYSVWNLAPADTILVRTGVALYGGFDGTETDQSQRDWQAHETILSGRDPGGMNQVLHVLTTEVSGDATVDGFTITEGLAFGLSEADRRGGGMLINGSQAAIRNCTFTGNSSLDGGAGLTATSSAVTIDNCVFSGNYGGGAHLHYCMFEITDASFVGNVNGPGLGASYAFGGIIGIDFAGNANPDLGGGLYNLQSYLTLADCTFANNSANEGGGAAAEQGTLEIVGCRFVGNTAEEGGGGGVGTADATLIMSQSLLLENTARYGGGLAFSQSIGSICEGLVSNSVFARNEATNPTSLTAGGGAIVTTSDQGLTLIGCTIVDNVTHGSLAGGIHDYMGKESTLIGSIVWGNTPPGWLSDSGLHDVHYSDVQGIMIPDPPNLLSLDPEFQPGSYELQPGSPCIDAGSTGAEVPTTDILGRPRRDGDGNGSVIPDMGAYEYQP